MRRQSLFIDTSGWASYFHARDPLHTRAVQIYQQAYGRGARIYTTDHVLAELVALLTSTHFKLPRPCVLAIIATILHDRGVIAQATGWPEFLEAWRLLEQRPDLASPANGLATVIQVALGAPAVGVRTVTAFG